MATLTARLIRCDLRASNGKIGARRESGAPLQPVSVPQKAAGVTMLENQYRNILLQPRLCTLRSYGDDRFGVVKRKKDGSGGGGGGDYEVSRFFETLSEYIESSKKSQDFEIILGRFAMVIFAATVALEVVTGNSVLRKLDLVGIEEAGGACFGAVVFAAIFAWVSSARNRVGKIFTFGCNSFIDTIIDDLVDGLFYDTDLSDWSDEL
ncbi:Stress enhanced protein 2, chloroplastic [Linum perenne]